MKCETCNTVRLNSTTCPDCGEATDFEPREIFPALVVGIVAMVFVATGCLGLFINFVIGG